MTSEYHNQNDEDKTFLLQCRPKLEALEKIRLEKLATYNSRKKLAVPLGGGITSVCGGIDYLLMTIQGDDKDFVGVTVIALALLWGWVTAPKKQYIKAYKIDILPEIVKLFGNFTYNLKGIMDLDRFKQAKILPHHTSKKMEDYISGQYGGTDIEFCELKLTRKAGKQTKTVFQGLAVIINLQHKKFLGHTIIEHDIGKANYLAKMNYKDLKRANLVDPKFEDIFDIYTDDQVEARYLIHPKMMEDLLALQKEYNGKALRGAFYKNNMFILIPSNHNHFEPVGIHKVAMSMSSILKIKQEIKKILSIVDKLKLYNSKTIDTQKMEE